MEKIMETMNQISMETQEATLSLAQRLLLQGEKKGKIEGEKETQFKLISNMLKKGLQAEQIADLTEIPLEEVKEIEKKVKK